MGNLSASGAVAAFALFLSLALLVGGVALLVLTRTKSLWRTAVGLAGVTVGAALFLFGGGLAALGSADPTWLRDGLVLLAVGGGLYIAVNFGNRLGAWVGIGAASLAFMLEPDAARAAETARSIPIPPELVSMAVEGVFLILSAGVLWVIRRGAAWLHIEREDRLVRRFEAGAEAALSFAREVLLRNGADLGDVKVRSELVEMAAGYLAPKLPGVLKELRIDPAGLRDRLTGRMDAVAPHPAAETMPGRLRGA